MSFYPRYNQKSGDVPGFKTFLKSHDLSPGIILRYVGNRIHVLFHMAGTVIMILQELITFLSRYSSKKKLGNAVLGDLKNPAILVQLQVLGLLGKHLTGPWMVIFYKNAEKKANLRMRPHIMTAMAGLRKLETNPELLLTSATDVFKRPIENDAVLTALRNAPPNDQFNSLAVTLVKSSITVLDRQLERYISGDLASPTPEMFEICSSAPNNNFHAERVLGKFSAQFARAPNATTGFLDAKTKAAANHTLEYVTSQPNTVQTQMMAFARRVGACRRKEISDREKEVDKEMLKRQRALAQKQDTKERRKVDKRVKSLLIDGDVEGLIGEVEESMKGLVRKVLEKGDVEGIRVSHMWSVEEEDIEFHGALIGFRDSKGKRMIQIRYHQEGQESVFEEIETHVFVTDAVVGDLNLD